MSVEFLIMSAPAELILELGIFFMTAAGCLLALSIEAGTYADLREWMATVRKTLSRHRRLHQRLVLDAQDTRAAFA